MGSLRHVAPWTLTVGALALSTGASYYDDSSEYPDLSSHCSASRLHQTRCDPCAADHVPRVTVGTDTAIVLSAAECNALPLGAGGAEAVAIPLAVEFLWDEVDSIHISTEGCVPDADRYFAHVARFVPAEPPRESQAYCVSCDGLSPSPACWASFTLTSQPASPPPDFEVLDVYIERGGVDAECADDALFLKLAGIHPPFFEEGGYLEVEYESSRHDIANTFAEAVPPFDEVVSEYMKFAFFAPLPEDEEVRVRTVNAAGVVGAWVPIDVTGLGTTSVERHGCSTARAGSQLGAGPAGPLVMFALFACLRGRTRRKWR